MINASINTPAKISVKSLVIGDVSKRSLGLDAVDNTSDLDKPISTAQQTAINLKADQATTYTKTEVDTNIANLVDTAPAALDTLNELAAALGDDANFSTTVTNSIATKASQTDLDTHIGDANNPHGVTATQVGLGSVDNTSDIDKPVSTAQQDELDLKADLSTTQDALDLKADQSTTQAALDLKADQSTTQAALDLKADQATTYTKTEVDTNIANLVDTAPATLDTLNELAAALGDDANFSTTVTNSIATKASQTDLDTHIGDANNPHGVTAAQVGLGNVTNASMASMFTDPTFSDRIRIAYEAPSSNEWWLQAETQARFSIIESFNTEPNRTFVVDRYSNVEINTLTLAKNNRYETRSSPSYTTVREFQKSLISDDGVVPTSSAVQKYIAETSPITVITGTGGETHSRYKSDGWLKSEITDIDTSFGTSDIEAVRFGSEVDSIVSTIFKARAGLKFVDFGLIPMVNFEACRNCPDLERVIMRTSNQIGQSAFHDCTSLSDVDLGSVTNIGFNAFKNCTALESITIPASVTVLGNTVFDGCSSLSEVNCYADESVFDPAGGNVLRGTASPLVIHVKIESDWQTGTGLDFQGNTNVTVINDLV